MGSARDAFVKEFGCNGDAFNWDRMLRAVISEARSEAKIEAYSDPSNWKDFKGNTPHYWWAKATAYGGIVAEVCNAFKSLGYQGEFGDLDTLAGRLAEFAGTLKAQVKTEALEEAANRWEADKGFDKNGVSTWLRKWAKGGKP